MKKIVLIVVILVLSGVAVNAQIQRYDSYPFNPYPHPDTTNLYKGLLTNEEYFENSDYVLEVIKLSKDKLGIDYYASKRGADVNVENEDGELKTAINEDEIYSAPMVKVLRVYKGKNVKEGDTIVAFAKGGYLLINFTTYNFIHKKYDILTTIIGNGSGYPDDPGIDISSWNPSIIFGNDAEFPKGLDKYENDHYLKIKIPNRTKAGLFWKDGKFSGLNGLHFENRYALCKYMTQFEGIDMQLSDYDKMRKYLLGDDDAHNQYIKEWNINLQERSDSIIQFMLQRREELLKSVEKKKQNDGKVGVDLTFSTINQQQTYYNNKHYFEFDIAVSVNSSNVYLYYLEPWISYNTTAFGQNIQNNGKLTVTNYIYETYGEIYADYTYNGANNELAISYLYNDGSGNKVQLSSTPMKILHIKIELQPNLNNIPAQIQFLSEEAHNSFYTTTANGTLAIFFDNIYFNNPSFILNNMPPSISSFSPATVRAGLGEVLTINGSKFGNQKGKVIFTSAEDIVTTNDGFLKGLDDQYITISDWTDTQIKVKVPSFVTDGYIEGGEHTLGYGSSAGTGKIKVITADNITSATSANPLTIEYSVTNYKSNDAPTTPIERVYLARIDCDYDFWFVLHTSIRDDANKTQIITAIETALTKWRDSTKLNIQLVKDGSDYAYVSSFSTNTNVIGFDAVNGFMSTTGRYLLDPGINKRYRATGSHIRVNPSYTWHYNTTTAAPAGKVSFYNTILHELGHILLLGHIYDVGKLMHASENHLISNPIINFSTQTSAINGAKRIVQDSRPPNFSWSWTPPLQILADSIPKPVITSNAGFAICTGSTITLTTSALSGASYQWKKDGVNFATTQSITISTAGQYTVNVSRNSCIRTSDPVIVTIAPMIGNITSSQTWNTDKTLCQNIAVQSGATLTISATATVFSSNYTITIMNGGKLILSGGTINNGNIIAQNGSELTITNNGKILLGNYNNFDVQLGAIFNFGYGEISLK